MGAKLQAAQALFDQGKLADAGKLCREVLDLQPDDFAALHLLGIIACQTGQPGEAIELLGKAIAAMPGSAEVYNSLGAVLAQLGRPEQALLSYAQAITLKPDFAEAHDNHGKMVHELQRPDLRSPGIMHFANNCPQCGAAAFQCVDPEA